MPRPIIDGRPTGFCKLIVDRGDHTILGCHIVGERAVELAQLAAIAVAARLKVEQLALVPFSFPTYANVLGRAAIRVARQFDPHSSWADQGTAWNAGSGRGRSMIETPWLARHGAGAGGDAPAAYSCNGTSSAPHAAITGSTMRQASSASSPRMNSIGSPLSISSIRWA